MSDKPVKPKPAFYAKCFETLQNIAKENGYNLLLHGSMNRDMDLVAIPWIDEPKSHLELIHAFADFLGIHKYDKPEYYQFSVLPGGRFSYVLNLFRGNKHLHVVDIGPWEEAQYYIDLSITPLVFKEHALTHWFENEDGHFYEHCFIDQEWKPTGRKR